jgi:Flp pilus assembly protein TadB
MNTALLATVFGAMMVAGLIALVVSVRPHTPAARPVRPRPRLITAVSGMSPRSRMILAASIAAGLLIAATTGWVAAVVVVPVAALGLPYLLAPPATAAQIRRVEAMEEWTRSLAGVLGAGVGLEQALTATLRSTPEPIRPEVTQLVARLRARWDTEAALRAFADDLDDVTGDLVAANLILAARRRNRSLAHALQGVAESVAEDVSSRRRVEAGRAKPRGSARLVTGFSLTVLVVLAVTGDYVAPYGSPAGQVILLVLLTAYAGALLWMKKMAQGQPFPRFLGPQARAGAR